MLRTWCTALVISLMLTAPAVAQAPMTNQSVIDLAKAKMSDDIILAAIRGSKSSFDKALDKGEYAVVLYSSQIRSTGYFLSGLDSYFDFGVD